MKFGIIIILVFLDFLSKKIIFNFIELNNFVSILPFMYITHIHNYGISFGLFSGILPSWFIILSGSLLIIFITMWLIKSTSRLERWGLLFIISGAIGNVGDRMINNFVIDFIYLYYKDYYWPAFNFADIYISIGILIIIFESFKFFKTRLKVNND